MRISKNRLRIFFITLLIMLTVLSNTVFAAAQMDTKRKTSLTIRYNVDNNPVSGIEFKLYRVADVSSTGKFTAVGDFTGYSVSFDGLTTEGWSDLATTLEGYVFRDKPNPAMRGKTDGNGMVSFSDCAQGLYLLLGDKHVSGRYTYTPQSLLVSLPNMNNDGSWDYDVTSEPKFSSDRIGDGSNDMQYMAKKVWKDEINPSKRPETIIVQLLRDDSVYDEKTLDESNNWQYTWTNLSNSYTWRVVEKSVPDGYIISVSRNGYVFTITNTISNNNPINPDNSTSNPSDNPDNSTSNPSDNPDNSTSNPSDNPDNSTSNPSDNPDNSTSNPDNPSSNPENPSDPNDPNNPNRPNNPNNPKDTPGSDDPYINKLPQSGMLKWPIPVMYILGAGIFFTGCYYRKKDAGTGDEDE